MDAYEKYNENGKYCVIDFDSITIRVPYPVEVLIDGEMRQIETGSELKAILYVSGFGASDVF